MKENILLGKVRRNQIIDKKILVQSLKKQK
jgi:hypothetical protein